MKLQTRSLHLGYENRLVVEGLDLELPSGKITTFIGPNGSGKSTLLRSLARLLKPQQGSVLLDGKAIHRLPTKEVARQLAILVQGPQAPEGLTVEALAWFGRYPHQGFLARRTEADQEAVERALQQTGMVVFRDRPLETLSGGQRQRAWIAMALAQDTPLLLLDEPTTFLDLSHQLEVIQLLQRLNREQGKTVVMVLHDLNQAARYSHELVAIDAGQVVAQGPPAEVITPHLLRRVFGLEAHITLDPDAGTPHVIPYGLSRRS